MACAMCYYCDVHRNILTKAMMVITTVTILLVVAFLYYDPGTWIGITLVHTVQLGSQLNSIRNLSPQNHHTHFEHGYVAAMRYSGQQGTGIQALMSLQCFIGSLNLPMYILEPVMDGTTFGSPLKVNSGSTSHSFLKFSDMFEISHFNIASRKMGFGEIRSENDFFTNAPTQVILVDSHRSRKVNPIEVVWTSRDKGDCYGDKDIPKHFCIVRVVQVTGKKDMKSSYQLFSEEELFGILLGPWLPNNVTIIFKQWHTPWYVSNKEQKDSLKCTNIRAIKQEILFHTSPKLLQDAQLYKSQFLGSKNRLAIMFRLERMMIYLQTIINRENKDITGMNGYMSSCLHEVKDIANDVWKKKGFSRPLVTLDLGKYGSISWRKKALFNLIQEVDSTLAFLFQSQWTFSEWEESFTQVASVAYSSGYIAALQRTLASQADCLVLVGGGYFQELALNDYKRNHPDKRTWCVYLICTVNSEVLSQNVEYNVIDMYKVKH